jgi:hypothetical protein
MSQRKLTNQSPNSYAALASELKPGEKLVVTYRGAKTEITSQGDISTKVAPILADENVDLREVTFKAES